MEMDLAYKGLSSAQAAEALKKFGPNKLPEKPPPTALQVFLEQLKSPLVYVLLGAGVITVILEDFSDAVIIFAAVFINTVLGFVQEERAGKALQALKGLIRPTAKLMRDGKEIQVPVGEIVPGDLVVLSQGDKVSADGEVVFANRLYIAEAILTGESVPVSKKVGDKGFMGTIITAGKGYLKVTKTGADTEIGKIASRVQEVQDDTPLRRQLAIFSKHLTILTVCLVAFVFIVGLSTGKDLVEVFITSVALAVSSIPEGLLVALTVVLAIGTQRILKRKGLVRNLVSAETLGGVTTICADKTGTLTEGKMRVVEVVGNEDEIAMQAIIANDRDDPVVIAMGEWARLRYATAKQGSVDELLGKQRRLDSIPFSSKNKFFASLNAFGGKENMLYVNGAPDVVVQWTTLSSAERKTVEGEIERLSAAGMRVLGMARKKLSDEKKVIDEKDAQDGLSWVGLLAFTDPPRKGVSEAIAKTRDAGIRMVVITGDFPETAKVVMAELGLALSDEDIITGDVLSNMETEELAGKLKGKETLLFARTDPEQKLQIVDALKHNGEVVAMTGDGVNDAPALAKADIGIVVGEATDVAKETADLVLLDSSFETIVAAIEEGRGIFDNIRKIILYLLADAFEEIIAVIGTIIFRMPLLVSASQILYINLISDGFPNLALTLDPKSPNIMKRPPRSPKELIVAPWMRLLILIVSLVGGIMAFGVFAYSYNKTQDINFARSVAFGTLGVNSLIYVFSVRTLTEPFWKESPFDNDYLELAVLGGFVLQILPFLVPSVGRFLGIEPIGLFYWGLIFGASFIMFFTIEIMKFIFRENLKRHHHEI